MPEVKATAKDIGASPKRLKPIVDLVRGKPVNQALDTLGLLSSPWARVVAKVVRCRRRQCREQPVDESG